MPRVPMSYYAEPSVARSEVAAGALAGATGVSRRCGEPSEPTHHPTTSGCQLNPEPRSVRGPRRTLVSPPLALVAAFLLHALGETPADDS
ncbi:unnamed protein product [Lota lota]